MRRPTRLGHVDVVSTFPREPIHRAPVIDTTPVIIRGCDTLGKVREWTPEHISERLAEREVRVSVADEDGAFAYDPDAGADQHFEKLPGSRIAAEFRREPVIRKLSLQQIPVSALPELAEELTVPPYVPADKINDINLWMAAAESRTPLHYDDMHNIFAQIEGRKRFLLFNPAQFDNLYPGPLNTRVQSQSRVNLRKPDFRRFPKLEGVEYWEAVVWPGDLLFMPAYWWHQVSSQDLSVSVNYWWRPDVRDVLTPAFFRDLYMTMSLEDVHGLFESFDFTALGGGADGILGLAELALEHGEAGAALRLCGGLVVAAARKAGVAAEDVSAVLLALDSTPGLLGPERPRARQCLTMAMAARPGRPVSSSEVSDLVGWLRMST